MTSNHVKSGKTKIKTEIFTVAGDIAILLAVTDGTSRKIEVLKSTLYLNNMIAYLN